MAQTDGSKKRKHEDATNGTAELTDRPKKVKKQLDEVENGIVETPKEKKSKKEKKDKSEKSEKEAKKERKEKKEKKEKKDKKEKKVKLAEDVDRVEPEAKPKKEKKEKKVKIDEAVGDVDAEKKAKKEKKRKLKAEEQLEDPTDTAAVSNEPEADPDTPMSEEALKAAKKKAKKEKQKAAKKAAYEAKQNGEEGAEPVQAPGPKPRFIVFVGNLPFSATLPTVTNHFKKLAPKSIRLIQDKDTGKCKGIAFVEFEDWDRMNTAIDKYHHTSFDDGISPARKINIELTAGGGGKSDTRKAKIKEKNEKLHVQRQNAQLKKKEEGKEDGERDVHDGMHPSRRAQIGV